MANDEILVLAPYGRDAEVIASVLGRARLECRPVSSMPELIEVLGECPGALVITEEALAPAAVPGLLAWLEDQPAWSDLPILLLSPPEPCTLSSAAVRLTLERNVTVLQRPVTELTLASAAQATIAARRRQYEVRDLLVREQLARQEAEAAIRLKDEFLATVSHELRTPIGAILLWSGMLDSEQLSEAQQRSGIRAIAVSAQAQSQLVEDLLDVSKMMLGRVRLELQTTAIGPLVQAALDIVQPMADATGVRIELERAAAVDFVRADPDRMRQIMWNLLSNAVKFTPAGGRITVRLERDRDQVVIVVADTGRGIAPGFLPHVFERFRQQDAGARRTGGLGLGLSIVAQLVELHGGTITAESAGEGHGATFTIRVPAARLE
jgi:signal transduction histidine kinase